MELQRTKVAFKNLSAFARKNDIHVNDGNGDITSAFVVTLINAAKKLIPKKIKRIFKKQLESRFIYFF